MRLLLSTLAGGLLAAAMAGDASAAQATSPCACLTAYDAQARQVGQVVSITGRNVLISESASYAQGAKGSGLQIGSRISVGAGSSASISIGSACRTTVPENVTADIVREQGKLCVRMIGAQGMDTAATTLQSAPVTFGAPEIGDPALPSFIRANLPKLLFANLAGFQLLSWAVDNADDNDPLPPQGASR